MELETLRVFGGKSHFLAEAIKLISISIENELMADTSKLLFCLKVYI